MQSLSVLTTITQNGTHAQIGDEDKKILMSRSSLEVLLLLLTRGVEEGRRPERKGSSLVIRGITLSRVVGLKINLPGR